MKRITFIFLALGLFITSSLGQKKPLVYILATGGTIAGVGSSKVSSGYSAGVVSVDQILAAVPEVMQLADIKGEQVVNIPSQDMNEDVWLLLSKRVNQILAQPDVTAIVITHGTDTMEETAYFLNLVVKSDKPVVLVGSMRPSTAISAEGPINIYDGVACAIAPDSKGKGVMIVMDDKILGADDAVKINTVSVETFHCPNYGYLGYMYNSKPIFTRESQKRHTTQSEFDISNVQKLPKVTIIYGYAGIDSTMVYHAMNDGTKGIVYAGVGNGNPNTTNLNVLALVVKKGIPVVRSTRAPQGPTTQFDEVDDSKYGFSASWFKSPQKSRILLMLALGKTTDFKEIQRMFLDY